MQIFMVIYACILIVSFVAVISSFLFPHIAARPEWMAHDPEIFYGFWGSCAVLRANGLQMESPKVSQNMRFGNSWFSCFVAPPRGRFEVLTTTEIHSHTRPKLRVSVFLQFSKRPQTNTCVPPRSIESQGLQDHQRMAGHFLQQTPVTANECALGAGLPSVPFIKGRNRSNTEWNNRNIRNQANQFEFSKISPFRTLADDVVFFFYIYMLKY